MKKNYAAKSRKRVKSSRTDRMSIDKILLNVKLTDVLNKKESIPLINW